MRNPFNNLSKELTQKIKKYILLGLAILSIVFTILLLFVPFCLCRTSLTDTETQAIIPMQAFAMLKNEATLLDGVAFLSLSVFIVLTVCIVIAAFFFVKCISSFLNNEDKLYETTKKLLIFSSAVTGFYFFGGIIACVIIRSLEGLARTASNFYPFGVLFVVDVVFAVIGGRFFNQEANAGNATVQDAIKQRQLRVKIYKARAELLIMTILLTGLAVFAILSNIITVTYKTTEPVNLSGLTMIRDYLNLDTGGQLIAFILLVFLTAILTTFFLSLVAFLSRSKLFYKLSLATIATSILAAFLVGMFGKYYQIVQTLNESMLGSYIQGLLPDVSLPDIEYEVTSSSLSYFLISIAVVAVLLVRNPYTRGMAIEREIELYQESENPQTIKGEIALTDLPENAVQRNDGSIVAADQATGTQTVLFADPCPIFTQLDEKIPQFNEDLEKKRQSLFENPSLPKLVQFIVQYARDSRLHLSYTEEDIATFIAGLGTTKLSILQGMSGTGKTSLPKIFAEALHARCEIIEVESSWRDKNELLGYYNEFSKNYTPKKFTQALYRAKLNPETLTFIVLDEMNLSRIEYYFSDFLSLMENEPDKRELRLVNVGLFRIENGNKVSYRGITDGHTLQIPSNVWFIGTANRDESTFEISDKVYDRAHTMNFNKRAAKVTYYGDPIPQRFLPVDTLEYLFNEAKQSVRFNVEAYPIIAEVENLLAPYNISFGNRIAMQIENFVNVYASCFSSSESVIQNAVERILLSKVVSKLELKSVENKEQLAAQFERLQLRKCSEFILKLNED